MQLSHAHENLIEQLRDKSVARLPWLWDKCLAFPWMDYKPQEHDSCSASRNCLYRNTDTASDKVCNSTAVGSSAETISGISLHVYGVREL